MAGHGHEHSGQLAGQQPADKLTLTAVPLTVQVLCKISLATAQLRPSAMRWQH